MASRSVVAIALFAPVLWGQAIGYGTSVVVLRSPKLLLAAVDSKETWQTWTGGATSIEEGTTCKVARLGDFYAIVAGIAHGSNGFNALETAARAWAPGATLDGLANRARDLIPDTLIPLLGSVRDADPGGFAGRFAGQAALQLTLVGTEAGQPRVVVLEFIAGGETHGPVGLSVRTNGCPGSCPNPTSAYFLGTHERIDEFLKRDSGFIGHPDERRAEALINLEYAGRPDLVGGPLSMVRVGKSGAAMVRTGACSLD